MKTRVWMQIGGVAVSTLVLSASVLADLVPIGPFSGELSESWESFPTTPPESGYLPDPTVIMGGAAAVSNPAMIVFEPGIHDWGLGSSGGAQPSDGVKGMGVQGIWQTVVVTFDEPMRRFGAYWGAWTSADLGIPSFVEVAIFDDAGELIGEDVFPYARPFDGVLEWHGWESDIQFKTLTYTEDFVAIDGLQASIVPEPGTVTIAFVLLVAVCGFRRMRR